MGWEEKAQAPKHRQYLKSKTTINFNSMCNTYNTKY